MVISAKGPTPLMAAGPSSAPTKGPTQRRPGRQARETTKEATVSISWDMETDVAIVGYGGAGAIAAATAHDSGARVLILEKAPQGGGNTLMSGGYILWPTNVEDGASHANALSWGTTPEKVCRAWAVGANKSKDWADGMGFKYRIRDNAAEFKGLPGSSSISNLLVTGGGKTMFSALDAAVKSRDIEVLLGTRATELVQDPATLEIMGVRAHKGSKDLTVWTRRAVVLCTGGFEFDEVMKANFLRCYPVRFWGWQYNTGDGIRMAQRVGAGLWHMNAISAGLSAWFPKYPSSWRVFAPSSGYIIVDKHGRRYCDETSLFSFRHTLAYALTEFEPETTEYARIPTFMIFDEATRNAGPLSQDLGFGVASIPAELGGAPKWSQDNSAEVEKGWIIKGATVSELASRINDVTDWGSTPSDIGGPVSVTIDPGVLSTTVAEYNDYCASKEDLDFGRNPDTLTPLINPPFYSIALWPGGPNTLGGPVRNERAQVVDSSGKPIPRLYSAGELGSIFGFLYPASGGNVSELIVFGQIAGRNAAAERPRAPEPERATRGRRET